MDSTTSTTTTPSSNIREIEGSLFDAPNRAALIHSCNCQGTWGKGIAATFKKKYPTAFAIYKSHCQKFKSHPRSRLIEAEEPGAPSISIQEPLETALIIPPQISDWKGKKHYIVCLFTSLKSGKDVSSPGVIIENTKLAVADMKAQLAKLRSESEIGVGELWSCRFNAGLFKVDWALSRKVLEDAGLDVTVVVPE